MKREEVLNTAKACVCGDRDEQYGSPEDSFSAIADLLETYIAARCVAGKEYDLCITPVDVAAMMVLFHDGALQGGPDCHREKQGRQLDRHRRLRRLRRGGERVSRKKMRELEERNDFMAREIVDQRDRNASLKKEIFWAKISKEQAEKSFITAVEDLGKYKGLYADEMQKRLELAEMARKLEEENRRLRGELAEVLGDG